MTRIIPALIVVAIVGLVLALGQSRADEATAARSITIPTAGQIETQFHRAQECRRALGVPVFQTSRGWETAKRGPYYVWMHALWRSRYLECRGATQRANEDVRYAIRLIFRGPGDPRYAYADSAAEQAVRVAWCESRWTTWDRLGQYAGVGQLGNQERAEYGIGVYASRDPEAAITASAVLQVRSFYRMFVAAGRSWGRWSCRPGDGGETSSWVAY